MADITNETNAIANAIYGEQVRGAIIDALEAMNGQAEVAEAWATGGSGGTPSATNNAKYYSDHANEQAQAWATGGSGGTPSATNNAKYYSEQANAIAQQWATGGSGGTPSATNNAKYYSEQAAASAATFETDVTLSVSGKAADAKSTGDHVMMYYTPPASPATFGFSDMPRYSYTFCDVSRFTDAPSDISGVVCITRTPFNTAGNISHVTLQLRDTPQNVYYSRFTEGATFPGWSKVATTSNIPVIDAGLTHSGQAADAEATGSRLSDIENGLRIVNPGWEQGVIDSSSGRASSADYSIRTAYIPCEPGEQFLKYNLINGRPATDSCYFYDSSKVFLSRNTSNIAPENAAYMRTTVNRGSGNIVVPSDGKNYAILRFGNVLSNEVGGRAFYTQNAATHVMDINFPVSAGDKVACMILEWDGDMPPTFSVRGLNGTTASSSLATANNLYQCFACDIATDYPQLRIRADVATTPSTATKFTALVFKVGSDKISNLAYALGSQIDSTLSVSGKAADAQATGARLSDTGARLSDIENGLRIVNPGWEQGYIDSTGGNTSADYSIRTGYIPCAPGEQFVKYNLLNGRPSIDWCYFYDSSKVFLSRNGNNIAPENAAYMRTTINRGSGNTIVPSDGKNYAIMRFGNVLSNEVGGRAFFTQNAASHTMDINFPVSAGDKIACMILEWGGNMPPRFSVRGLDGDTATSDLCTASGLFECMVCTFTADYPQLRIRADVATTPSTATKFTALVFKVGSDKISNLAYALGSQIDDTISVSGKAADAKATGDKIAEIGDKTQQINDSIKNFVDVVFPQKSGFAGTLRQNAVSYSTGDITTSSSGRYCASSFCKYTTDMVISLNLPEYLWHAWSYSTAADTYPTHSNTGKALVDGAVPIFIKKKMQDAYFVFEIRRKDGEVLTTDLEDPTSDYSRIMDALRVTTAHPAVERSNDGYIYRLESNPSPVPIGDSALGYSAFLTQTWDTFLSDYPAEVTKTAIGVSSTTESITTEYPIYKYVLAPRDWTRTVFLSAGCHGNEYEGFWGLYRVMRMIWDEGYKYPNLRKLRYNTRFVVVPIWNPWGVENRVRECPLGFPTQENLNRPVTLDGTTYEPFASKECQAIKAIFDEYEGQLSFWGDLHTDPFSAYHTPSPSKKGCYGYATNQSAVNRVLYGLTVDFHNIIKAETGYSTNITIYNGDTNSIWREPGYATGRGVPSAVLETSIDEFAESGTATLMKYAQEWYGNVIAAMIEVC